MSTARFRIPDDIDMVPHNRSGVYRFSLRFPSDYELGLCDSCPDVSTAIAQMSALLNSFQAASHGASLHGEIFTAGVRSHLQTEYVIHAKPTIDVGTVLAQEFPGEACTLTAACEAANVLRSVLDGTIPLYVGMTARQSFKARLTQHLSGKTAIKEQMASHKLSWANLWFDIIPIEKQTADLIPKLERIAQATIKPSFCKA